MSAESLHPAEAARLTRRASTTPQPGSLEEAEALERLAWEREQIRDPGEKAPRRPLERFWRDRGHQVDGQ